MKNTILASICFGVLHSINVSAAQPPRAACPVQGELVHWIADWCMLTLGTDDEIAAGDCIAKELELASKDACRAKLKYKSAMCRVVIARDASGTLAGCMAEPGFAGSTVRKGGVGGRPGSADSPSPARPTRR